MRKVCTKALLALVLAVLLAACGQTVREEDVVGRTYTYEKEGFGGNFAISLHEDGTFTYYEGSLSSYIGTGDWTLEGETLTLQEKNRHFTFRAEKDCLVFQEKQSGDFTYIKVSDQEEFTAETE